MHQLFHFFLIVPTVLFSQAGRTDSFRMYHDVRITVDAPVHYRHTKSLLIIYALPNGNTTEQTMGKKMQNGDDWHFDIQHIKAQTMFLRSKLKQNIVVAYLENDLKSWPAWKQKHPLFKNEIQHIVDTLYRSIPSKKTAVYLNGHSGGGSFIFGFIDGVEKIPAKVERITFLDSNYGYDSTHTEKIRDWLAGNRSVRLTVFAYNDSVALYNGRPVVSARGGTWYKSRLMMRNLEEEFVFRMEDQDSLKIYYDKKKRIGFFFKTNPLQKIYHTRQVELNGFIHSVLFGTKKENEDYLYYGKRAYEHLIR